MNEPEEKHTLSNKVLEKMYKNAEKLLYTDSNAQDARDALHEIMDLCDTPYDGLTLRDFLIKDIIFLIARYGAHEEAIMRTTVKRIEKLRDEVITQSRG